MLQLKKKGNSWSTSLLIPRKAQVLSYVITDGLLVDDNGKRTFVLPLFGDDGRPVQGAYLRFDDLIRLTGGSYEAQYSAAKREKDLYPRNYSSYYAYWRLWYLRSRASKQVRDSIVEEIEHLLARDSLDVDLWNAVAVTYYYTLRDWDKSWELKNRISETDRWPMTVEIKDVRKAEEEGKKIKADGEKRREALLNNMAPDFRLKSFKGDTVSLSDLRGNVVLVCFWSSSGGPSRILAPRLQFLLDVNRGTQLRLLSISLDMKREDVPPFEAARELTFPVLYGDEQISSQYGIVSLPTTYLVDKSGKIRHIHVGFVLGRGLEWLEEIHALIKEP
jgi:peroxiredoxin